MQKSKNAFTMIELVFVIVVLGILAAIAIPRFAATRLDAQISKGRSDVASIRSAIVTERQAWLIRGESRFIGTTTANGTGRAMMNNGGLFGGVLTYGIVAGGATEDGKWRNTATDVNTSTYQFRLQGADNTFVYSVSNGRFLCTGGTYCSELTD